MSSDAMVKPASGDVGQSGDEKCADEANVETKPATCELVDMVVKATWEEALRRLGGSPSNPLPLWTMLASRILRAVANGERDPQRLERFALEGLNAQNGRSKDC
jgi:hypothetical protein